MQLESSNFVAIEIVSGSREYLQFSNIYRIVPIPSVFFIGGNGAPVEIATGIVASVEEMEEKILRTLKAVGKEPLLAKDDAMDADDSVQDDNQPTTSASVRIANNLLNSQPVEVKGTVNVAAADDVAAQPVEAEKKQSKPLVEEKKLQQKPANKEEKINAQREWQEKRHLKKLQDELKRERFEEQQARERIRAQIAADKIERAARSMQSNNPNADLSDNEAAAMQQRSASPMEIVTARLQFRFGSGNTNTKVFNKMTTMADIRAYVQRELLPGTGIKDYILVTSYPKREFTKEHNNMTLEQLGLIPTAVILIIAKEFTTTTVFANTYGNLLSTFSALLWTMINPIIATLIHAKDWLTGITSSTTESRAQKHTSGDSGSPAR